MVAAGISVAVRSAKAVSANRRCLVGRWHLLQGLHLTGVKCSASLLYRRAGFQKHKLRATQRLEGCQESCTIN